MSEYRIIIAGQLEFGNRKVFQQVLDQYTHRMENYYKADILLKPEAVFKEEELTFDVPRTVVVGSEREWLNTVNLLERVVSFAMAGSLHLWRLGAGTMLDNLLLEPNAERTTVQLFNQGRTLVDQTDKEQEALVKLTQVVDRFARHAQAYERRGFVNMSLGNLDDALYDYNKSLNIHANMPEAHYGRGLVYTRRDDWAAAAQDFEAVTRNSIPHQKIYWMAQVALGDCYLKLGKPADALRVYNMFSKRKQRIESLNRYDRRVNYAFGQLLLASGRANDAVQAFQRALNAEADRKAPAEHLIHAELANAYEAAGDKKKATEHRDLADKKKVTTDPSPALAE